jgi:hypothetical protein
MISHVCIVYLKAIDRRDSATKAIANMAKGKDDLAAINNEINEGMNELQ